ncbi:MAG: hypothetical protein KDE35_05165 [Geminicoccaceae bacterium]|nr:hypothetical protein [Geminicoccaceae bacterium]
MVAYLATMGLAERPFRLEPDLRFLFPASAQRAALHAYTTLLAGRERLAVLTGQPGVGKTTFARLLEAHLHGDGIAVGYWRAEHIDGFAWSAVEAPDGRRTLLMVDEAQRLDADRLRRLADKADRPGRHMLLIGRAELVARMRSSAVDDPRMMRVVDRAIRLQPLTSREIVPYVHHRLRKVGWTGGRIMNMVACDRLFLASGGLPRAVGRICSRALALAAIDGASELDGARIDDAVADLVRRPKDEGSGDQPGSTSLLHARLDALHEALARERARGDRLLDDADRERRRAAQLDLAAAQRLLHWLGRVRLEAADPPDAGRRDGRGQGVHR